MCVYELLGPQLLRKLYDKLGVLLTDTTHSHSSPWQVGISFWYDEGGGAKGWPRMNDGKLIHNRTVRSSLNLTVLYIVYCGFKSI